MVRMEHTEQKTDGGVRLRRTLGLSWREGRVETDGVRDALMYDNEAVLANHAWFEDFERGPYDELPGHEGTEALEARINLLVAMMGIWMRRQVTAPRSVPVVLGEETLCWDDTEAPPQDAQLLVELYLSARFPLPLVLPVQVVRVEEAAEDDRRHIATRLVGLSAGTRQGIARVVFRYHRRALRERHAREVDDGKAAHKPPES